MKAVMSSRKKREAFDKFTRLQQEIDTNLQWKYQECLGLRRYVDRKGWFP